MNKAKIQKAEIAKFNPRELREYEYSRKAYRDLKNCLDTAMREGLETFLLIMHFYLAQTASGVLLSAKNI